MTVEEALVDLVANLDERLLVGVDQAPADAEIAGVVDGVSVLSARPSLKYCLTFEARWCTWIAGLRCVRSVQVLKLATRAATGQRKISWNVAGTRGPRGLRGPSGRRGPAGTAGTAGANGQTGPQGTQGQTGVAGPTGPTGLTGPSGTAEFAEFYALMPPDNPATVEPGRAVSFPQDGHRAAR